MTKFATGGRDDSRGANDILKIGTAVPNRIFVGGISGSTSEEDLRNLFSKFGNVKATKVIVDKAGISKGYGFVTFETEEEAQKILVEVDCLTLKDKRLNIAPAVKKQPYGRSLETTSMNSAPLIWSAQPYSGTTGLGSKESVYYPQFYVVGRGIAKRKSPLLESEEVRFVLRSYSFGQETKLKTTEVQLAHWPLVWPQLYLPQQCHYPPVPQTGYPQYVYPVPPSDYYYPSLGTVSGSDFSETSSADSTDSGKPRSKATCSTPVPLDYDRGKQIQQKVAHTPTSSHRHGNGNVESPTSYVHSSPFQNLHHVLAKTVNGVTMMAYPSSFVMGSPTILHLKEGNGETDGMLTDLGFLPSSIASGSLTPPPTPLASLSCDFNVNTSMEMIRKN
ncbi:uncharacterized protein LOC129219045 [Uloborus diversus]|uniref:uncharacterized protein LOC129219045 n=1 Tax=Uloborus diversus TaxID=327109 RepID=UPI0024097622|nr:uncharacterized protein LOC129219045 [Uloborus diversus]